MGFYVNMFLLQFLTDKDLPIQTRISRKILAHTRSGRTVVYM